MLPPSPPEASLAARILSRMASESAGEAPADALYRGPPILPPPPPEASLAARILSPRAGEPAVEAPADPLYRVRHGFAHVLAMAVLKLRPNAKLGFGPPIDDGFYYDFVLDEPLSED